MLADKKKPATMFDFIDGVTYKKKAWSEYSETEQKSFSPYMINRFLSMRMDLIEIINEFQRYTVGLLRPSETYKLYHDFLPKQKSFAKYIKGKSEDRFDKELIEQIAEHYQVGKSEATDYVELLDKTKCEHILSLYGYSEAEKKKLLKGIR